MVPIPRGDKASPACVALYPSGPSLNAGKNTIDEHVYRRYEYAAVDLYKNRFQTPHMVVRMGETVFTTVMVFLERI